MRGIRIAVTGILIIFVGAPVAMAREFDWFKRFNAAARADLPAFRARLAARFNVGDSQIELVMGNVPTPADAYMVFRLGEMSGQGWEAVLERHKAARGEGWGVLAKRLGIKPGSREFKALKRRHDLEGLHSGDRKAGPGKVPKARPMVGPAGDVEVKPKVGPASESREGPRADPVKDSRGRSKTREQ